MIMNIRFEIMHINGIWHILAIKRLNSISVFKNEKINGYLKMDKNSYHRKMIEEFNGYLDNFGMPHSKFIGFKEEHEVKRALEWVEATYIINHLN